LVKVLELQNRVLHVHCDEPGCCAGLHVCI
jgi:hypothetical protein